MHTSKEREREKNDNHKAADCVEYGYRLNMKINKKQREEKKDQWKMPRDKRFNT